MVHGMDEKLWEQYGDVDEITLDEFTYQMMVQEKVEDQKNNKFTMLEKKVVEQLPAYKQYNLDNNPFFEKMCNNQEVQQLFMEAVNVTKVMHIAWRKWLCTAAGKALKLLDPNDKEEFMDYEQFIEKHKNIDCNDKNNIEAVRQFKLALYFNMYFQRMAVKKICPWLQDTYNPTQNCMPNYETNGGKERKRCKPSE
jgi:hypothetical protein